MAIQALLKKVKVHPVWGPFYSSVRSLFPRRRFLVCRLDITNRCNLRCWMCNREFAVLHDTLPIPADLTPDRYSRIAREVFPVTRTLYLSAGAEPLMSRHFLPILDITAGYRIPMVSLFTNGTLLDEEKAEHLVKTHVTQVCISVDGATAGTYEAIRVGARFETVIANIRRLQAIKKRLNSETPHVSLQIVLMKRNIEEFPAFVDMAAGLGVRHISYCHQVLYTGLEDESLVHHPELSDRYLGMAVRRATELGIEIVGPPPFGSPGGPETPASVERGAAPRPSRLCSIPWVEMVINLDGAVLPCCAWYHDEPMGNIFEQSFDRIWLGEKYESLRRKLEEGADLPESCRRCPIVCLERGEREKFPVVTPGIGAPGE